MKKRFLPLLSVAFLTIACTATMSATPNPVETEVARQLTLNASASAAAPAASITTTQPQGAASDTSSPPTPTETPTETLTPTPTESPTPSPSFTYTPPSTDPRNSLGSPTWKTTFPADDTTLGNPASLPTFLTNFTLELANHNLKATNKSNSSYDEWFLTAYRPEKFYLEMSSRFEQCDGKDRYGLFFSVPESDNSTGFLYEFSCAGQFIVRYVENGKFSDTPFNWTTKSAINSGSGPTNRMGVKVQGDYMAFFANGVFLGDKTDSRLAKGRFGLAFAVTSGNYILWISELAYWNLP